MPNKIRAGSIYTILVLSLFVTSCSLQQEPITQVSSKITWDNLQIAPRTNENLCPELSYEGLDINDEQTKQGFTYGLVERILPAELSASDKIAFRTFWVNANEQLILNWHFWYPEGNEGPLDLRLFILLDEQQLPNVLPQPGIYNDVRLEKGDDVTIQLTIPALTAGVHDVVAIAIPSPENEPDEYGTVDLIANRITLIAEPTPSPFRTIDFVSLPAEGSIKKDDPGMAIELTLTSKEDRKNGIRVWNWPDPWLTVNADTPARFYALAGYEDVTNQDAPSMEPLEKSFFATLLFVDYRQVDIIPNQKVLYGAVDKDNAYTRIPIELSLLPEGKHSILALRIDTPGAPYCILRGNTKERVLPFGINGILVGINVFPAK